MTKSEQFASPWLNTPTKKLHNHAISCKISFKFCRCSSYGVMTIWAKFQENWRGCPDHFLRIDTEWSISYLQNQSYFHFRRKTVAPSSVTRLDVWYRSWSPTMKSSLYAMYSLNELMTWLRISSCISLWICENTNSQECENSAVTERRCILRSSWTSKTIDSRKTRAKRLRWKTLCTGNDGRCYSEKSREELSSKIKRSQTWNCFFTQTGTDSETESTAKPQGIRTNIARAEVNVPRWQSHSWDVGACRH